MKTSDNYWNEMAKDIEFSLYDFEYPFDNTKCQTFDELQQIYNPIPIEPNSELSSIPINLLDLIDFTVKINNDDILYARPGQRDGAKWKLVFKFNDIYVYYVAWCDYSGFDCQGGVSIYASYDLDFLLKNALTKKDRSDLKINIDDYNDNDYNNDNYNENENYNDNENNDDNDNYNENNEELILPNFSYPFSHTSCSDEHDIENIYKNIPIKPNSELSSKMVNLKDLINFTERLKEKDILYARPGSNDCADWLLVAKLNDLYIYYTAWCAYSGFDYDGDMSLYASYDLEFLLKYCLSTYERHLLKIYDYDDDDDDDIYANCKLHCLF